jgi:hypothetical protein
LFFDLQREGREADVLREKERINTSTPLGVPKESFWMRTALVFFLGTLSLISSFETNTTGPATVGLWWWTWSSNTQVPSGTNCGVAFSGWSDPYQALQDSGGIKSRLPGRKYISLGGGDADGRFSSNDLTNIKNAIYSDAFYGYDGIVFDIEEGDSGLGDAFKSCFSAARSKGFSVLVTISYSAPYGIPDAANLMRSFFSNSDINYLSPQLYTTGTENYNQYGTIAGVQWSEYASAKATIIPSIVSGYLYDDAVSFFRSQGVTLEGYVQWAQS